MRHNEFDNELKYKLFRNIREILHPTISKKNISNYKIILDEKLMPVRIFYPKKVTNMKKVIIFIHGNGEITKCEGKYSDISSCFSKELDQLIISIDYEDLKDNYLEDIYKEIYKTFKFIYNGLIELIDKNNITLFGDSTGASLVLYINNQMVKDGITISKEVLFYPVLSGEYFGKTKYGSIKDKTLDSDLIRQLKDYYNKKLKNIKSRSNYKYFQLKSKKENRYPNTLLLCGKVDPLIDENIEFAKNKNINLKEIPFASHGFLGTKDKEIKKEYINHIIQFMNDDNDKM